MVKRLRLFEREIFPFRPLLPLLPLQRSCRLAQAKQTQTFRVAQPNFLSEGVRFGAKSKLSRMGVYLAYIPIRGNELGAEDDPLSQEILNYLKSRYSLTYLISSHAKSLVTSTVTLRFLPSTSCFSSYDI